MSHYTALSVKQPFANLICSGEKTIETRTWTTDYRGDLLIVSSKQPHIPLAGYALALVELYDCQPMQKEDWLQACCKTYRNAFGWHLRNIRPLKTPIPIRGQLGLYQIHDPRICL